MRNRAELISSLATFALFVTLETCSLLMAGNRGIIQKFSIFGAARSIQTSIWSKTCQVRNYVNLKEENEELFAENSLLRQQMENLRTKIQNEEQVSVDIIPGYTYYTASVVKNSVDRQHNYLVIDKGGKSGIKRGMGVVTHNGVIGIVENVSENFSYVVSLLNVEQSVSARILGTGEFGPMVWSGTSEGTAFLRDIPVYSEAALGDTVVTSGFSTVYPPDIPLGKIEDIATIHGASLTMSIRLFENFRALKKVYVVRSNQAEEINQLIPDHEQ